MPITFPLTKMTIVVEIALGADLTADPATWAWTNITTYVRYKPAIQIVRGRRDEGSTVDPASARLTLDNRDGRFVRRNPSGPYFGQLSKNTPIRIGCNPGDGTHYRFHGYVNEWPTRWSKDQRDSTVPIVCAGVLRRLAQNRRLGSALTRAMAGISAGDFRPIAHWPMEDGSDAVRFGSAVAGVNAAVVGGAAGTVSPASYSGASGSDAVPVLNADGKIAATFPPMTITASGSGDKIWQYQFMGMVPSAIAANSVFLDLYVTDMGGDHVVQLRVSWVDASSLMRLSLFDRTGTHVSTDMDVDFSAAPILYDTPVLFGISVFTAAVSPTLATGQFAAYLPGRSAAVAGTFGVTWNSSGIPIPLSWRAYGDTANAGWSFSHAALYTDPGIFISPNQQDNADAINGYEGEMAHDRLTRVCREEGVVFTTSATVSAAMGPQPNDILLNVLRDCEKADLGILYENQFGLGYLSLAERYNASSVLDLDFRQADIAEAIEPADDDQQTVNYYTASKPSGAVAVFYDATSIADDGLYTGSGTHNVETDDQIPDVASWQVHLGIVDKDRYPAVPIRLARTPVRITAWVAATIGSQMTLANPPSQMASATVTAVIQGWSESFNPHMWEAVLNTSPASGYTVGEWDDAGSLWDTAVWAL